MSPTRGYHNYRGRTSKGKIALAVLLVLIILAALSVMAMQRYIVYDENGRPHLELPQQEPDKPEETPDDLDITIEETRKDPEIRAVQLTETPLTDSAWQERKMSIPASSTLAVSRASTVVLTAKDASGHVYYDSAAAAAVSASIVQTETSTAAAIAEMNETYPYTIARLACFLDPIAAKADVEGMGLKNTGGYIFYDGNNSNWLDPGKPAARQYLCSMAKELAELGFDEILLTDVSYPTAGKLDKINYGETMKNQNLAAFLEEMDAALADSDVKLSLELPETVIAEGSDNIAGLMLADVAPKVDRIYAVATEERSEALAAEVVAAGENTGFVPELSADTGSGAAGSYLWLPE